MINTKSMNFDSLLKSDFCDKDLEKIKTNLKQIDTKIDSPDKHEIKKAKKNLEVNKNKYLLKKIKFSTINRNI